jgi:hypothetical protein
MLLLRATMRRVNCDYNIPIATRPPPPLSPAQPSRSQ